jgi:hypothetical protein
MVGKEGAWALKAGILSGTGWVHFGGAVIGIRKFLFFYRRKWYKGCRMGAGVF